MINSAVIGYSSLDFAAVVDGYFRGDQTVLISDRPRDAFPRPGGCPLYVAMPIASQGGQVSIISWVGDDDLGQQMIDYATEKSISVDAISIIPEAATPMCFLIYQADGSCGCCFDPGMMGREVLTPNQIEKIENAGLVCFTVGPPEIGATALRHVRGDAIVAWVAKFDPISFTEELRRGLAKRADYVFCNTSEREWIDEALKDRTGSPPVIVQTNGSGQVLVQTGDTMTHVEVTPLSVSDTTGAGDTLAGGCIAAIAGGEMEPKQIARAGVDAAGSMLAAR